MKQNLMHQINKDNVKIIFKTLMAKTFGIQYDENDNMIPNQNSEFCHYGLYHISNLYQMISFLGMNKLDWYNKAEQAILHFMANTRENILKDLPIEALRHKNNLTYDLIELNEIVMYEQITFHTIMLFQELLFQIAKHLRNQSLPENELEVWKKYVPFKNCTLNAFL